MTRLGLPYQGGKSKLADWIIDLFPKAAHFYDLCAGGCAVAHAALLSGKFEHVHANDITDSVTLFEDALNGDLDKYEPERFRTREDFFAEKDSNPFVRIAYSFGCDQATYLYSREIESYKKAVHEMLYAPTPNERRLKFKAVIREMAKLGLIEYKSGDRRCDCESKERIDAVTCLQSDENTPPPNPLQKLTQQQHIEASNRIGSVSMSGCKARNAQNKSER